MKIQVGELDYVAASQQNYHPIGWAEFDDLDTVDYQDDGIAGFGSKLKKIGKKATKAVKKAGKVVAKPTKKLVAVTKSNAKKVGKALKKVAPVAGPAAALLPGVGPMLGGVLGILGSKSGMTQGIVPGEGGGYPMQVAEGGGGSGGGGGLPAWLLPVAGAGLLGLVLLKRR